MPRTIDGFAARTTAHPFPARPLPQMQPLLPQPLPAPQEQAMPAPVIAPIAPPRIYARPAPALRQRRGIPERLQLPLIIGGAIAAGLFAQAAVFGELLVVAYGFGALLWRVASRTTFTLALLSMVATTLLLVVRGNIILAQNFATYTFLLLVVGVITLIRELKKEGGRVYNSRKNIT